MDAAKMTNGAINAELKSLDIKRSAITRALIEAGRGHETCRDLERGTDALSVKWQRLDARYRELNMEGSLRYGPRYLPGCLPRGGARERGE